MRAHRVQLAVTIQSTVAAFSFVMSLVVAIPVTAQTTYTWTNTSGISSYYHQASNWSPNTGIPGIDDTAFFNEDQTYDVWWNSATGNRDLRYFELSAGQASLINLENTNQPTLTIQGSGGNGQLTDFRLVQGNVNSLHDSQLTIRGLHVHSLGGAWIGPSIFGRTPTLWVDGSHPMGSQFTVSGVAGLRVDGRLRATEGGRVDTIFTTVGGGFGELEISGLGSKLTSLGYVDLGNNGAGTATVSSGGSIAADSIYLGFISGDSGVLNVSGTGSLVDLSGQDGLVVGYGGTGQVNISSNATLLSQKAEIGVLAGSSGSVNLQDGSALNLFRISIGQQGQGSLNVLSGSMVNSNLADLGMGSGSGIVNVSGTGSTWVNTNGLSVGGNLNVSAGGMVQTASLFSKGSVSVSSGTLSTQNAVIGSSTGSTGTVNLDSSSIWNATSSITIGQFGNGTLNVLGGSDVTSVSGGVGVSSGLGIANVSGAGSSWNTSGDLSIGANGTMTVGSGGLVQVGGLANWNGAISASTGTLSTGISAIGSSSGSTGIVTLQNNSGWNSSATIYVGQSGNGTLNVQSGSDVTSTNGTIGADAGSTGSVNVSGAGSSWSISNNLQVGSGGSGTLTIGTGGLVQVGGTTTIGNSGSLDLVGGTLDFGHVDMNTFTRINANSGTLRGTVSQNQYTHANSLPYLTSSWANSLNTNGVRLANSGTLYGQASLGCSLANQTSGEVEVLAGERMRFGSTEASTNAGEINNYGGVIRFNGAVQNQTTGFVAGRGQFIADGGWTNQGVMSFSGGNTDLLGDVYNDIAGKIVTTGGGTATFFDDVISNGEIRTSQNSSTVFLGGVSGSGNYTGTGTVYYEGDLRPGNSPGVTSYGGDVVFSETATLHIELGGLALGTYDKLVIAGDLSLSGDLAVSLFNFHTLGFAEQYLIADISGSLFGRFNFLDEGDLVGHFGSQDLFITYLAGNGNDIALITAVPEPSALVLVGLCGVLVSMRRHRRPEFAPKA